jgi:hyperosmotically inducible protein
MQTTRVMTHAALIMALTGFGIQASAQTRNDPPTDTQKRSAGQTVNDATITARVKSALVGDDLVKARNIDVDTKSGVVWLNGTVASDAEKNKAISLARQVDGVREVQNRLTIGSASTGSSSDRAPSSPVRSPEERKQP